MLGLMLGLYKKYSKQASSLSPSLSSSRMFKGLFDLAELHTCSPHSNHIFNLFSCTVTDFLFVFCLLTFVKTDRMTLK